MRLAIFGDIHGKLDEAYRHVGAGEARTGEPIHAVLQVGDTGFYPDPGTVDGATRRHLDAGNAGLSYLPYLEGDLEPRWTMYFVRGNHEDFDFLNAHQGEPIDPHGRLIHTEDSVVRELAGPLGSVSLLGLGGIEPPNVKQTKWEAHIGRKYIHPDAAARALELEPGSVDILLTHDAPWSYGLRDNPETGSRMVLEVVKHLEPRFHFYGHYNDPPGPFTLGQTRCIGLHQDVGRPDTRGAPAVLDTVSWACRLPGGEVLSLEV